MRCQLVISGAASEVGHRPMAQAAAAGSPWVQSVSTNGGSGTVNSQGCGVSSADSIKCRARRMSVRAQAGSPTSDSSPMDDYEVLGLSHHASKSDVKTAYRRLALQFHPDVCKGDHCEMKFKQVRAAYEQIVRQLEQEDATEDLADFCWEGMMGVGDESWSEWEEWMGFEGGVPDLQFH